VITLSLEALSAIAAAVTGMVVAILKGHRDIGEARGACRDLKARISDLEQRVSSIEGGWGEPEIDRGHEDPPSDQFTINWDLEPPF
jgi:hypothetical protein